MTVGNVKGAAAAYQGSGLENGTSQKVSSESKPIENIQMADTQSRSSQKQEPGVKPIESSEASKNESVKRAVEQINKKAKNSEAIFGIHDETNRVTIKIVDKETKEIIREYPPEETLDMIAKAWELAGLLVDEKR